ncbi:hypothetical protein Ancab_040492 [Ancistrocladus abbreviatus]
MSAKEEKDKSARGLGTSNTLKKRKPIPMGKPSKSSSVSGSAQRKTHQKIVKKDMGTHKLVFEEGGLLDGTELEYRVNGETLLKGYKKDHGIMCGCCGSVVTPSKFEAHAGFASRRKPYNCIYTSGGVSLSELSISLARERSNKDSQKASKHVDGGNLESQYSSPRVFDPDNANALASRRAFVGDAIDEVDKRCIRIVEDFEADVTSCALCRGSDSSKSGFEPCTILFCDQCEKGYHAGCLKEHKMADHKELPKGNWFCSTDCRLIHSTLQSFLDQGAEKVPTSLVNALRKKHTGSSSENVGDFNFEWLVISGTNASGEAKQLLSQAIAIFNDSFSLIFDGRTDPDLIPAMVYGRNLHGREHKGMYCSLLTLNSVVVSAAVFRVLGPEFVELPLVATVNGSHGKGYFRILFTCMEGFFESLKVKSIVLVAAEEAQAIWTDKFEFWKMAPDQVQSCRKSFRSMTIFRGTVLYKNILDDWAQNASSDC